MNLESSTNEKRTRKPIDRKQSAEGNRQMLRPADEIRRKANVFRGLWTYKIS